MNHHDYSINQSPNSPVAIMSTTHSLSIDKKITKRSKKKSSRGKSIKSILNHDSTILISKLSSSSTTTTTTKKVRSSKSNIPGESRYWTPSEHKLFVEALLTYGPKDLKSIANYVGTRNMIQCRTHEQKCFMRLMREAQRETIHRHGEHNPQHLTDIVDIQKAKLQKDVYSVPSSCGLALLGAVVEEVNRSLNE